MRPWTKEELRSAIDMRAEGLSYYRIAKALGRSMNSIYSKLGFHTEEGDKITTIKNHEGPRIPAHVLADRERRQQLQPRDLTAYLMGDPVR